MANPIPVDIGSDFTEFPGGSFNELVAEYHRQKAKYGSFNPSRSSAHLPCVAVTCKNVGEVALEFGGVAHWNDTIINATQRPSVVYETPTAAIGGCRITVANLVNLKVILRDSLAIGEIKQSVGVIFGLAWARVYINNPGHQLVKATHEEVAGTECGRYFLETTTESDATAHIVWAEDEGAGTGEKWALVFLNQPINATSGEPGEGIEYFPGCGLQLTGGNMFGIHPNTAGFGLVWDSVNCAYHVNGSLGITTTASSVKLHDGSFATAFNSGSSKQLYGHSFGVFGWFPDETGGGGGGGVSSGCPSIIVTGGGTIVSFGAASAAGAGLTGTGCILNVGAGHAVAVNADDVGLHTTGYNAGQQQQYVHHAGAFQWVFAYTVKVTTSDTGAAFLHDSFQDNANSYNSSNDSLIQFQTVGAGGTNQFERAFFDSSTISGWNGAGIQLLGHVSGVLQWDTIANWLNRLTGYSAGSTQIIGHAAGGSTEWKAVTTKVINSPTDIDLTLTSTQLTSNLDYTPVTLQLWPAASDGSAAAFNKSVSVDDCD